MALLSGCAADTATEDSAGLATRTGVDYAWSKPSPQALHAGGYTFASRYLSYDTSGKNLTHNEATALRAAGVDVVANWEYGTKDALKGYNEGVRNAHDAEAQATAAGMPAGRPIYFSVDFDTQPSQQGTINAYFDGVASVLGIERTGAYGGYYTIKRLFDAGKIRWGWQTYAWSNGQWDSRAQLRQIRNGVTIDGADCDIDQSVAEDFGQWGYSAAPTAQIRFFDGDFTGDGTADHLFYSRTDSNWWLGSSNATGLQWNLAGNTIGFGDMLDGNRALVTGDFNGDGKTDVAFYYKGDGNWWLGLSDGSTLHWTLAGNVAGFGDLIDGSRRILTGDFDGDGKTDVAFYYAGDGNWWLGHSTGTAFTWSNAGNVAGFGNLLDPSRELFTGDFDGDGKTDVAFYWAGDGNWWVGRSTGTAFAWSNAGNVAGFGNLLDPSRRLFTGDFNGDGKTDVAFYWAGDGNWWSGLSDGHTFAWHQAGNVAGFGSLLDPSRRLFIGDFTGDHKTDVRLYYNGDSNWWTGVSDGNQLGWHLAGNTAGFGNLLR